MNMNYPNTDLDTIYKIRASIINNNSLEIRLDVKA